MKYFIRKFAEIVSYYLKDIWYSYMIMGIKKELEQEKKELENAKKDLDPMYDDFVDDYRKYKDDKKLSDL